MDHTVLYCLLFSRRSMNWTASPAPLAIRVVIITAFPPELRRWISSVPLSEQVSWVYQTPLRLNASLGVLGVTTGMGPMRATAGLMSLGHDERFDLSRSYFLVAGIAGVDPHFGSIGSAFIARYLVGLGGDYLLDGIGHVPHGRTSVDFGPPLPSLDDARAQNRLHTLNLPMAEWALSFGATARLPDSAALKEARRAYTADDEAPARQPPSVRYGDSVSGPTFGAGRAWTAWARNVTHYWSGGRGTFAVTQMEDLGVATALTTLTRIRRANVSRLVVMRSASDFSYPPARRPISEWFFHDPLHMRTQEAFDALITAGMPIVRGMLAAFADCDESTAVKKASGCTVAGPWSPPSLGIKTLIGTRYDSSEDGLVIALPWWAVWFIVALAAGVVPLLMSAVACLVWRRRRRAWLTRGSPAMAGTSSLPPAHLRHVQLHEVGEQCGSQHACPSGMSR